MTSMNFSTGLDIFFPHQVKIVGMSILMSLSEGGSQCNKIDDSLLTNCTWKADAFALWF